MFAHQELIGFGATTTGFTTLGTLGTWGDTPTTNRRIDNAVDQRGGFQFTTGAFASELSSVDFSVITVGTGASWHCELWSNNAGNPGSKIGSDSSAVNISTTGQKTFTWSSRISLSASTTYWIIFTPDTLGTSDIYFSVVANNASYGSGRKTTITSMTTADLPSAEDWRCQVSYYY